MTKIAMFKPYVNASAIKRVVAVLQSGWIGEGPSVKEFEQALSKRVGNPHVVAVNSGTSALHLALLVAGIRPGDEVVTTAQTMLATTTAILAAGAIPVYADVVYATGNLDPASVRSRITSRTRAILPVDWAGYPCDWAEILSIARSSGLAVIDDAAHALGASYQGRPIGSIAPYTCFSFQAIKHLTTGDGGLLCLPTETEYRSAFRRRWFGIDRQQRKPSILGEAEWNVRETGFKYHMNDIAAAVGLGNIEDFDANLNRRRTIVDR